MRVYLAPIIIVALIIAAIFFMVSCSTGFRGSIGFFNSPRAAVTGSPIAEHA